MQVTEKMRHMQGSERPPILSLNIMMLMILVVQKRGLHEKDQASSIETGSDKASRGTSSTSRGQAVARHGTSDSGAENYSPDLLSLVAIRETQRHESRPSVAVLSGGRRAIPQRPGSTH